MFRAVMCFTKLLPTMILIVVVVALVRPGHAQPEPPAEPCRVPADASSAEAWYWLGKAQAKEGRKRCAMEAYARSWELQPSYDNADNCGAYAAMVGEHGVACKFLSYSIANVPASLDEQKKQVALERMRDILEESLRHVGRARVQTRPGAMILVDGEPAGTAPLNPPELCLPPGSRTIEARLEGFQPAKATIDVKIGPPHAVELPLQLAVAEPPKPQPVPDAEGTGDPLFAAGIAGLVVGGAGVFTGVTVLLLSAAKTDKVDELIAEILADPRFAGNPCGDGPLESPAACSDLTDASDAKLTYRNLGITAVVVGGLLLASATYLLIGREEPEADVAVNVLPMVDQQHGGVLLSGSF